MVAAALCAVIFVYIFGFAAFYNPGMKYAHLNSFLGLFALGVFLVSLFVAFLLTSKHEAWSAAMRFGLLATFVA